MFIAYFCMRMRRLMKGEKMGERRKRSMAKYGAGWGEGINYPALFEWGSQRENLAVEQHLRWEDI